MRDNERTKLTATYLNGTAIAIFAIGGVAPLSSLATGTASATPLALAAMTLSSFLTSGLVHVFALLTLRRLR